MKAVWFESFGSPSDVLIFGELEKPGIQANEVLVKMYTSGVNPSDVKKRAGAFPALLDDGLVIPHSDGAGIIEEVGSQVDCTRVGERVFVYQAQYGRRMGSSAEYLAIESLRAPPLPDNASFDVGACVGIPIMTAHRCVFADGAVAGKTVLVTGGAGRVGYYAIQWAKNAGARVIATASNQADKDLCIAMGASAVVNHREKDWSLAVNDAAHGTKIDRVIDVEFGANLTEILKCIAISGTIVTYSSTVVPEPKLPFRDMMFMDLNIRMVIVYAMPEEAKAAAVADTIAALNAGTLHHRIAAGLSFAEMAKAHELIEQSTAKGCVVVRINE
jgi:NADPH:quinone reductase-like Zn-dependent oxidoreductase